MKETKLAKLGPLFLFLGLFSFLTAMVLLKNTGNDSTLDWLKGFLTGSTIVFNLVGLFLTSRYHICKVGRL